MTKYRNGRLLKGPDNQRPEIRDQRSKPPSIAVVILSHNYGQFLFEAVESVLSQTLLPDEILIVDDASEDNTPELAREYEFWAHYLKIEKRNLFAARKAGFEATKSDWVLFLDADDRLAPQFLQSGLAQITDEVGIINADLQCFGDSTQLLRMDFDPRTFQCRNLIAGGASLYRRAAIESARAFEMAIGHETVEDWVFAKRILAQGWQVAKNPTSHLYRKHNASLCVKRGQSQQGPQGGYFHTAGLRHETITLFVPLSGRKQLWPRFADFLQRQTWPHEQTKLILMDTSGDAEFGRSVREWMAGSDYPDARYLAADVGEPGLADQNRFHTDVCRQVRLAMPRIYNRAVRESTGEYLWIVEDDMIPPVDAGERLLAGFDSHVASVSGAYRSHLHDGYPIWSDPQRPMKSVFCSPQRGITEGGGNGFGCVILRRSVVSRAVFTHQGNWSDYDLNFYGWLSRLDGGRWKSRLDWTIECEHVSTKSTQFVIVSAPRSGSYLLQRSLDRHPDIVCYGEVLNRACPVPVRDEQTDGREIMAKVFSTEARAVGCKLMDSHPFPDLPRWSSAWEWVKEHPEVKVIWLTRRDRLAQFASIQVAQQTGSWLIDSPDDPVLRDRPTVHVDPAEFCSWKTAQRQRLIELRRLLGRNCSIEVTYKNLVNDWTANIRRVQEFLGVEPHDLPQATIKGETRPLEEVIENYGVIS